MQIPIIKTDDENLKDVIDEINNRFDQIAREFNSSISMSSGSVSNDQYSLDNKGAVSKQLSARFVRFGQIDGSSTYDSSLFEDSADGELKYRKSNGDLEVLTGDSGGITLVGGTAGSTFDGSVDGGGA